MLQPDIRTWLATIGWSQPKLVAITGRNRQTIWRWCKGIHRPPWAISHWLEDLAKYHEAHPPPPLLDRYGREAVQRQPDIPQLPQEEQRDMGGVPADAGNDTAVSGHDTVANRHSVPHGAYRPPGG